MAVWRVSGTTTINVYVEVEAETLEEAIDICDSNINLTEYCDGNIGVDSYYADEISDVEVSENGYIDWSEEWSKEVM